MRSAVIEKEITDKEDSGTSQCPECGSQEIRRVRRITGYFSTVDLFNDAKRAELKDRVAHGKI